MTEQGYIIPDVDESVPTVNQFAGRWDRRLKAGLHEATITKAEIAPAKSSGNLKVGITYLVDGDEKICPEGPVNIDQHVLLPPNAQWSFRNFRDIFFPTKGNITQDQVKALVGARVKILTSRQEEKRDPKDERVILKKAGNNVDKIVALLQAAPPQEPDPFESAS